MPEPSCAEPSETTRSGPDWFRCIVGQWEKKAELSLLEGRVGEALKFADYANARDLYDDGVPIDAIQRRVSR
jgi:hypothetical protein